MNQYIFFSCLCARPAKSALTPVVIEAEEVKCTHVSIV